MASILGASGAAFETLLRLARASAADPPWFAPPIEAEEDEDALTVTFLAPEHKKRRVQLYATERELRLWERRAGGERTAFRVCSLPYPIVATAIETARAGDLLKVRLPKQRSAKALPEPSSEST
jgi:HSP20 family molecular chaperone IbpA